MNEPIEKWSLEKQKAALEVISFTRVLDELCLVGILNRVKEDGTPVPKEEVLKSYAKAEESEKLFINLIGKRAAARIYGKQEGVRSSMATVEWRLSSNAVEYYRKIINESVKQNEPSDSNSAETATSA